MAVSRRKQCQSSRCRRQSVDRRQARLAGQLAQRLRAAYARIDAMDSDALRTIAEQFGRKADCIQARESSIYPIARNTEHQMPTGILARETPTREALRLMVRAVMRAQDHCDRANRERLGYIEWGEDAWWRAGVLWMVHQATYGPSCPITGLPFDRTGRPQHPLAATLIAHRDHRRRLFEGTEELELGSVDAARVEQLAVSNAVVQSRIINRLIRSYPISCCSSSARTVQPGPLPVSR